MTHLLKLALNKALVVNLLIMERHTQQTMLGKLAVEVTAVAAATRAIPKMIC
jgi:hypothetical protein